MLKISEKILDVTCQFWCNIIKGGKDHDNGDKSFTGFMCSFLANSGTKSIDDEKLKVFSKELKNQILKEAKNRYTNYIVLYCDYGPGHLLYQAAEKAQINSLNFPWKTGVYVYENAVIENRPYARPEDETDSIIYCDKSYVINKIKEIKKWIDDLKAKELEEWETEENRKEYIESNTKRLESYEVFLNKMGECYLREDD